MALAFTSAVNKFFGRKTKEQTLPEFSAEIKALTTKDKHDLGPLLAVALKEEVTVDLDEKDEEASKAAGKDVKKNITYKPDAKNN